MTFKVANDGSHLSFDYIWPVSCKDRQHTEKLSITIILPTDLVSAGVSFCGNAVGNIHAAFLKNFSA